MARAWQGHDMAWHRGAAAAQRGMDSTSHGSMPNFHEHHMLSIHMACLPQCLPQCLPSPQRACHQPSARRTTPATPSPPTTHRWGGAWAVLRHVCDQALGMLSLPRLRAPSCSRTRAQPARRTPALNRPSFPAQSFEALALQKGAPRGVSRLMKPLKAFGYTVRQLLVGLIDEDGCTSSARVLAHTWRP